MILIPEQVKALRDKIIELEEEINDYIEYLKNCEKSCPDDGFVKYCDNSLEERDYEIKRAKLKEYKEALIKSEFLDQDSLVVDYGSKVVIKYDDEDYEETYTLLETSIGLESYLINRDNGYISVKSLLGENIKDKKVGDTFSYEVAVKGKKNKITISGRIIDIIKKTNKDLHFIMSRPKANRISKKNEIVRKDAYKNNDIKEFSKVYEITLSQYNLLKEEKERLTEALLRLKKDDDKISIGSIITLKDKKDNINKYTIVDKDDIDYSKEIDANTITFSRLISKKKGDYIDDVTHYYVNGKSKVQKYFGEIIDIDNSNVITLEKETTYLNIWAIYSRLGIVSRLLKNAKVVMPPCDDTIGVGSKVSVMTFEDGKVQNRRVEVINQAVSSELNSDYVEIISPLGQEIVSLSNNQRFTYNYYSNLMKRVVQGEGIVYDICNNTLEKLISNPLTYQKRKRG